MPSQDSRWAALRSVYSLDRRGAVVGESFVSSSVRKKPGLTTVVWMPNGSISGGERFHPAVDAELRRGVGGAVTQRRRARGGEGGHDIPDRLPADHRQTAR